MTDTERREKAIDLWRQGRKLHDSGRLNAAVVAYLASIELEPTAEAHSLLGWSLSHLNRLDEAIEHNRIAIALDPEYGPAYNDVGAYLMTQGKDEEAVPYFKASMTCKRQPTACYAHYNMGRYCERIEEWQQALEWYKKAIELKPDYQQAKDAYYRLLALFN